MIDNTSKGEKENKQQKKISLVLALSLFAISGLIFSGLANSSYAQSTEQTTDQTATQIVETQGAATQFLTNDLKDVGGLEINVRWSPVATLSPDSMSALFADCNPGEFAVSGIYMFENEDVEAVQSFPIAIPGDLMTWLTVLNNDGGERQQVATGVICIDDANADNSRTVSLDPKTRIVIQDTINRVIQEGDLLGGDTITNIDYVTKVYQTIIQKAIQIVNISGNNNTVNQVINQSANQIVETGGADVNQVIDQNAEQIVGQNTTTTVTPPQPIEDPENNETAQAATTTERVIVENTELPALPPDTGEEETTTTTEEETTTETETVDEPETGTTTETTTPESIPEAPTDEQVEVTDGETTDNYDGTADDDGGA